jgi:hypothetical protein
MSLKLKMEKLKIKTKVGQVLRPVKGGVPIFCLSSVTESGCPA